MASNSKTSHVAKLKELPRGKVGFAFRLHLLFTEWLSRPTYDDSIFEDPIKDILLDDPDFVKDAPIPEEGKI